MQLLDDRLTRPTTNTTRWPTKMSLFFFGDNFYKNQETFKIFSPQILDVYRIFLVETTLESIMFYYTFSVINTMFVPCTPLLYESTAASRRYSSVLFKKWGGASFLQQYTHLISRTEHLNTSGITSHGTDPFHVKPITLGHPFPKISTRLNIFWGVPERQSLWKQSADKRGHHQKRNQTDCTRNAQ